MTKISVITLFIGIASFVMLPGGAAKANMYNNGYTYNCGYYPCYQNNSNPYQYYVNPYQGYQNPYQYYVNPYQYYNNSSYGYTYPSYNPVITSPVVYINFPIYYSSYNAYGYSSYPTCDQYGCW